MKKKQKRQQKFGKCVYCGKLANLTVDHIPPKNLFSQPRPNNLITVPSCQKCNSAASKDDEYFRLVMATSINTNISESTKLRDKALRALEKPNKKGFQKAFLNRIKEVELYTPTGLFICNTALYNADFERLNKVASRIVRGLYFYHRKVSIPKRHIINVIPFQTLNPDDKELMNKISKVVSHILIKTPIIIGDDVFKYWHGFNDDEQDCSIWVLQFYNYFEFIVIVKRKI
ncbi:putative HNH endonuclease [Candidatus Desulfarcum epimagneticum]|uniref:Putative HNH endonuclease n=1 Tax=uncultured Desulfobacteraceae bacterium TaxID=218296 RepID=A0A484HJB3_9BACT|nr:putative HNH endonuclease [uncultured Desulfobacteraceae bacterium]